MKELQLKYFTGVVRLDAPIILDSKFARAWSRWNDGYIRIPHRLHLSTTHVSSLRRLRKGDIGKIYTKPVPMDTTKEKAPAYVSLMLDGQRRRMKYFSMHAADIDSHREFFTAIHFNKEQRQAWASDGYHLAALNLPDLKALPENTSISGPLLQHALGRAYKRGRLWLYDANGGAQLTLDGGAVSYFINRVCEERKPPDYKILYPAVTDLQRFDRHRLAERMKAAKVKSRRVRIVFTSDGLFVEPAPAATSCGEAHTHVFMDNMLPTLEVVKATHINIPARPTDILYLRGQDAEGLVMPCRGD